MQHRLSLFTHPYVLLTVTATFWAGNAIAGKFAVGHVSPFLLTTLRWAIACALLFPFAYPHLKKDWPTIKKHLPFLCLLGAVGFGVFNNSMYLALNSITAINAAIEQSSMPLVVFLFNFILFRNRPTSFQIVGFALTAIGVFITAAKGNVLGFTLQSMSTGDLLMFFAISMYAIYSVLLAKRPNIHLFSFLFVLGCAALGVSFVFAGFESGLGNTIWPDQQGWLVVLYTALFPSLISQLLWVMGVEKIGSNRSGVFINAVPIITVFLAIILLGEALELYHIVALLMVLGGVALAQKSSAKSD